MRTGYFFEFALKQKTRGGARAVYFFHRVTSYRILHKIQGNYLKGTSYNFSMRGYLVPQNRPSYIFF